MSVQTITETEEDAREVLRQACMDGGLIDEGGELPETIPLNVAIAAIILEGMMR